MTLARYYIDKIKIADSELERVGMEALVENIDFILKLIKEKQIQKGIKSDGSSAPTYSAATDMIANNAISAALGGRPRMDKVAGQPWNYTWSGEWIDSLYLKIMNDGFDVLASDSKTAMLEKMSEGRITKLTEENNKIINDEIVKPALWEHFINSVVR